MQKDLNPLLHQPQKSGRNNPRVGDTRHHLDYFEVEGFYTASKRSLKPKTDSASGL